MKNRIVFQKMGEQYFLATPGIESTTIGNGVYKIGVNREGQSFLYPVHEGFTFNYKLYGLEIKLIERILKTYRNTTTNIGCLFNGVKGTGKTVTAKLVCNALNQPVIIVEANNVAKFINMIPQDITVFVDEYEKIFKDSFELAGIMDGATNNEYRRAFILTTNDLNINVNMKERTGRIRYIKEFVDLKPEVIEEIVDDVLEHKHLRTACIKFISRLNLITIDIIKAIISEVNIHEEDPIEFADIFNVKTLKGKYDIFLLEGENQITLGRNIDLYPHPEFSFEDLNRGISINSKPIGTIQQVISTNIIKVAGLEMKTKIPPLWLKNGPVNLLIKNAEVFHENFLLGVDKMYQELSERKLNVDFEYTKLNNDPSITFFTKNDSNQSNNEIEDDLELQNMEAEILGHIMMSDNN